jgi:hypothetical protein
MIAEHLASSQLPTSVRFVQLTCSRCCHQFMVYSRRWSEHLTGNHFFPGKLSCMYTYICNNIHIMYIYIHISMQICHMSKPLLAPFVHIKIAGIDTTVPSPIIWGLGPWNVAAGEHFPNPGSTKKAMGCPWRPVQAQKKGRNVGPIRESWVWCKGFFLLVRAKTQGMFRNDSQ